MKKPDIKCVIYDFCDMLGANKDKCEIPFPVSSSLSLLSIRKASKRVE